MDNKSMSMTTNRHGSPVICSGMLIHICKIIILYEKISLAVFFRFYLKKCGKMNTYFSQCNPRRRRWCFEMCSDGCRGGMCAAFFNIRHTINFDSPVLRRIRGVSTKFNINVSYVVLSCTMMRRLLLYFCNLVH